MPIKPRKHVVMMSSGAGSWAAAKRVVERHGPENVVMLFSDVKGDSLSPHSGEDEDNYRFLNEAAANVGAELVVISEGRDIWRVYFDEHMLGNARVAPCSKRLKQIPARNWVKNNCTLGNTVIYIGIDWTEEHRLAPNRKGWEPWQVQAPMTEAPYLDKGDILDWLKAEGVTPPRLYDLGFSHANCGGFCCRMGQAQAERLLQTFPERYKYHEDQEQWFRHIFDTDSSFLVDRRNLAPGESRRPLTLKDFRLRLEADAGGFDRTDWGACGCFTPEDGENV